MLRFFKSAQISRRQVWWAIRQIFGDAAYETYLASVQRKEAHAAGDPVPLSRDEFYLESLKRRYSKISRCC
jgi:uncharacterized short protein YbdD (DUF466 family)